MQGPSFLPEELNQYKSFVTESGLIEALKKRPRDLIEFFEVAAEDEFWSEEHPRIMRSLMQWVTKNYYLDQFPLYMAKRIVTAIQKHFTVFKNWLYFKPSLFFTVTLTVENQTIVVNSLLFGVSSPFFHNLFKNQCFNKFREEWTLTKTTLPLFRLVEEYLLKGEIPDLWRYERPVILALMQQAKVWSLPLLVKECAAILHRYIDKNNVVETLIQAHQQFFNDWKRDAATVFNNQEWGLKIVLERESDLKVEVLNFKQETLELFYTLAPWITHLAFKGHLSEDLFYEELVSKCPRLVGMDLSNSIHYANQFDPLPFNLSDLDVSSCAWIDFSYIREINRQFPNLKNLNLGDNAHLNYMSWGELGRFQQLTILHLARSRQIGDEDLKLISQSCSQVSELDLDECRSFSDKGVVDLIHYCRRLTRLNLSHCYQLTDRSLIEIGSYALLTHLNLTRCIQLTDKGLIHLVQFCRSLKHLTVKQCEFTLKNLELIQRNYPQLEIIY